MKSILSSVAIFAAGAVTGGFIVWNYLKPKFEEAIEKAINEKIAPTEVDPSNKETASEAATARQMDLGEYQDIIKNAGYAQETPTNKRPYVITPEQLGDMDHDEVEFTLYGDGTLTDENNEPIDDDDLEEWVGRKNLERMGEHEKDMLYIRNENQGTDYIICRDLDPYFSI